MNKTVYTKLLTQPTSGTVAVDVGANLGFLSLVMASQVGLSGTVFSIEPNSSLHPYTQKLFHLNRLTNLVQLGYACSDEEGEMAMELNESNHTMLKISDNGTFKVKVMPLDKILSENKIPISFIKIDVEGHEAKTLQGATETLKKHRPALVFETGMHTDDDIKKIQRIFDETSYSIIGVIREWGIEEKPLSSKMTEKSHCNVLALPRNL